MNHSADLLKSPLHFHGFSDAALHATAASARTIAPKSIATNFGHRPPFGAGRREWAKGGKDHLLEILAHTVRIRSLGNMTVDLAHEVKLPISAIIQYTRGCIRRLEAGGMEPALLQETMDRILQQAERTAEIVHNIRELLARRKPERFDLDIALLIRQTLELVRVQSCCGGMHFRLQLDADLPTAEADAVQIKQVAFNLIQNAIEAANNLDPARQIVTIRAKASAAAGLLVTVSDRGPGCPADILRHIFEPFISTKPDGLGMGLAISRLIIESHGGRLWAVPNTNHGLSFHFTLPARKDARS